MQDRFKFRVWSYEDNRFIEDYNYPIGSDYFLELCQDGKLVKIGLGDYKDYDEHTHDWGTIDVFKNVKITFSTGLKDKNGELVYFDDFVKLDDCIVCIIKQIEDINDIEYGRVVAIPVFCFNKKYQTRYIPTVIAEGEKVGNLYENPELLESEPTNE